MSNCFAVYLLTSMKLNMHVIKLLPMIFYVISFPPPFKPFTVVEPKKSIFTCQRVGAIAEMVGRDKKSLLFCT